jgi:hypothetical protein
VCFKGSGFEIMLCLKGSCDWGVGQGRGVVHFSAVEPNLCVSRFWSMGLWVLNFEPCCHHDSYSAIQSDQITLGLVDDAKVCCLCVLCLAGQALCHAC